MPAQTRGRGPAPAVIAALSVRALTLLILVQVAGPDAVSRALGRLHPAWIGLVAAAELLTYPAYVIAYRSVARLGRRSSPSNLTMVRIVVAGFGPLALSGGFGVDRSLMRALDGDGASAQARVGAMACLEWAVLAPAAWLASAVLLLSGAGVSGSLLWPWILGTPVAVVAAVWASQPVRIERFSRLRGRRIGLLAHALDGVAAVRALARRPRRHVGAWCGTTAYWALEICALYGALRTAGIDVDAATAVLAYATGYLASRRSLPLGGAGVAEALLVYSLYELHEPLGPAVTAVMVYRLFNFLLVIVPAMVALHQLRPAPGSD